jgi:hypothetical protein
VVFVSFGVMPPKNVAAEVSPGTFAAWAMIASPSPAADPNTVSPTQLGNLFAGMLTTVPALAFVPAAGTLTLNALDPIQLTLRIG